MNIIFFALVSIGVFFVAAMIGSVVFLFKNNTINSASTCFVSTQDSVSLAQSIRSRNQYDDFNKTLQFVLEKYPNTYNPCGQVRKED